MSPTWVDVRAGSPFPVENLPWGVFDDGAGARVGVAIGDRIVDVHAVLGDEVFAAPALNPFMAQGPAAWRDARRRLTEALTDGGHRDRVAPHLVAQAAARMLLPFEVADYVDFYSSRHHAENLGRILRPGAEPLTPAWLHLPIGYHGRAGTVVVSGTPVRRPLGQRKSPADAAPVFGPSTRLDIEAEVGFVVGVPSTMGAPVPAERFADHVFGVVIVNDWSARDIQAWEYQPLGPFLGKSFATSVSPWVVTLDALAAARRPAPEVSPPPLPHLRDAEGWALDLELEVRLNGEVVSRPPFAQLHWTAAQQLAHLTSNGASLRTGDLFASGTVSGERADQRGSFIELSWNGAEPLTLADRTQRSFLDDGDTVSISATAPGTGGSRIGFGEVVGRIEPA